MKKKIDKTKPNMIKLHEKAPKLAKGFIEFENNITRLKTDAMKLKNIMKLEYAKKDILWDKVCDKFQQELDVIAPEGNYKFERDGDEIFIMKGAGTCDCSGCKGLPSLKKNIPPEFKKMLDELLKSGGNIKGFSISPDGITDLDDLFK